MADDVEVLREVWNGRLPVCFRLEDTEVHTVSAPEPLYLLLPRLTYFPLVTDKVRRHFARSVHPDHQSSDIWLDWDGYTLNCHQPVGLQFDLLCSGTALPWNVTVHFTNHSAESPLMKRDALESFFLASVKEADQLKHKGDVMTSLNKREHGQLWAGLSGDKFEQFWLVNRRLMAGGFRAVPARLHRPGLPYLQRPVSPACDGRPRLLRHWLQLLLPSLADRLAPDAEDPPRVVLHGVSPPLDAPLQWLSEHLSYADNFLHVVLLT